MARADSCRDAEPGEDSDGHCEHGSLPRRDHPRACTAISNRSRPPPTRTPSRAARRRRGDTTAPMRQPGVIDCRGRPVQKSSAERQHASARVPPVDGTPDAPTGLTRAEHTAHRGGQNMTRWIVAPLIVVLVSWAGAISAQQQPYAPAAPAAPAGQAPSAAPSAPEKVMQGTVKAVDEAK